MCERDGERWRESERERERVRGRESNVHSYMLCDPDESNLESLTAVTPSGIERTPTDSAVRLYCAVVHYYTSAKWVNQSHTFVPL